MTNPRTRIKKINVKDAVGLSLAHDITEIRADEFKGVAFPRGHLVQEKDICHLQRLGKQHLYVLDLDAAAVHEDEAVLEMVRSLSGSGIGFSPAPREGKIELYASHDGLLKVNKKGLTAFNLLPDVMCASVHTNTPVKKNNRVAGTRAIPLVIDRRVLDQALETARQYYPVFHVKPYQTAKARLIITGTEIFNGLVQDRFKPIVQKKLSDLGAVLVETVILPDDRKMISKTLTEFIENGTDLIITTGGMSVDPDDVTRLAVQDAGADRLFYSAAVLPGAMFQIAYKNQTPIMGIPACALYHRVTVFDLVLPRILAGETVTDRDLAELAHGGLCLDCEACTFPACSFGKS